MTDRFKFRVWDNNKKEYLDKGCIHRKGYLIIPTMKNDYSLEEAEGDFVVEQSTGLRDVNGQIIFEGDILGMSEGNALVVWNKQWVLNFGDFSEPFWHFSIERYTISGNIHENKELLK